MRGVVKFSMTSKCGGCGHQRQHHIFPAYSRPSKDSYGKPSQDPGCRIDHMKKWGSVKDPIFTTPLKTSAGTPCPCEEYSE